MWNPFKKITRSSISEAMGLTKPIPIQIQIIAAMEEMLDSLDVQTLPPPMKQVLPVPEDVTALMNVGFTGHKKVQDFKKRQKALNDDYDAKFKVYSELKDLLKTLNFVEIAQKYGVTDSAIRKRCKKYGLPSNKTELKEYLQNL